MTAGGEHHEQMPNGMRHGNQTIWLKKYDAQYIEGTAELQLQHAIEMVSREHDNERRTQTHDNIEEGLQTFVAFVIEL